VEVSLPQGKRRNLGSCIHYFLQRGSFCAFHKIRSDEIWGHFAGGPLMLHLISENGEYTSHILGTNAVEGHQPLVLIPASTLQGAEPLDSFALVSCTTFPGWDDADWEMPGFEQLASRLPLHTELLRRLTRSQRAEVSSLSHPS
jgi:predicted cupin superfamily sugar epimerase